MYYSDLHIHSRFARATSKNLNFLELTRWGIIKGLKVIGTGDILHPKWMQEFKRDLQYNSKTGFYSPTNEIIRALQNNEAEINISHIPNSILPEFIPTVETSHIYKHKGKVRRIHLVTIFKTIEDAIKIAKVLEDNNVNLTSDGRPIFGMPVKEYLQLLLNTLGEDNFNLIPAHIWTPWYALLGSKSGYDSIYDAFEDLTSYITAVETGLSSDPKMNREISELNNFLLVSNSDAHSAKKLGREANIHKQLENIEDLFESITTGKKLYGTIEFYPEEGRYHYDGHRKCKVHFTPEQTEEHKGICPVCKKPLTVGVLNRVYTLAKNTNNNSTNMVGQKLLNKYASIYSIPLETIIAEVYNTTPTSKKVAKQYFKLIETYGPELKILHEIDTNLIKDDLIACGINLMRKGDIKIKPGYDGEYGIVKINTSKCLNTQHGQLSLL